jgi:geranylgeranyl pyrophosphate synthase
LNDEVANENNEELAFDALRYQAYLNEARMGISTETSKLISRLNGFRLKKKIVYALQTRGKLLRPTMVLLSGQSVGGKKELLKKLALSVELLHNATLVHDDILDNDHFRRDALAVHSKWGVRSAILVGDALASLSLNLSSEYGEEISGLVAQACLSLCDGEYMDAIGVTNKVTEKYYFEKIDKKSAALFKVAAKCGAIAGGGTASEIKSLTKFGENFGIAYQITDDLSDITSLKDGVVPGQNDFQTLPFIHLYESTGKKENGLKVLSPEEIYGLLLSSNSLRYCSNKIKEYLDKAVANLDVLKDTCYKFYLLKMVENIITDNN